MSNRLSLQDVSVWRRFLHEQGYVVIADVLSPTQSAEALASMWTLMETLGRVRRDDPKSWSPSKNWPPMLHGGMIQYLGHTQLQWWLREQCAPVFAAYYTEPVDALATSFDGLCMMHGHRRYMRRGDLISFLHTDQAPHRTHEWSIQGLINLADAGEKDGGLVVIPGSHKKHQDFFDGHPHREKGGGDWYKFNNKERELYRKQAIKVCAKSGDFLL